MFCLCHLKSSMAAICSVQSRLYRWLRAQGGQGLLAFLLPAPSLRQCVTSLGLKIACQAFVPSLMLSAQKENSCVVRSCQELMRADR